MNLQYAVDRLYEVGWTPSTGMELERLADGRRFPSVMTIQKAFLTEGLDLAIKHNMMFNCYRAIWCPDGEEHETHPADHRHGTVIGACEREAAVYALAQLLAARQSFEISGAAAESATASL